MSNGSGWFALVVILIIIIIIVIFSILFFQREEQVLLGSVYQIIQNGLTSGNSDEVSNGGSILYIMNSSSNLNLTIPPGRSVNGIVIDIKNNTTASILNVIAGPGVTLNDGLLGITVSPSGLSRWVVIGNNSYLRTQ
uniref:Uncharacterized protein n=1 Tax=Pithovirus LCPAC104 TaxID=2506589 RepID=A0A481Z4W5_9VIRU|nr:MAG: hypothetical protein LCPAC104_01430 [Pithovirus LCPAC104]